MNHPANFRKPVAGVLAAGMAVFLFGCKPATPEATTPAAPAASSEPAAAPASGEPTLDPAAAPPSATAEAATPPAATLESHWQCGDQRVTARFDNAAQTVALVHDRGEVVLPQAISASGARYADTHGNEFWTKGAEGTLTLSGTPARQCSEINGG